MTRKYFLEYLSRKESLTNSQLRSEPHLYSDLPFRHLLNPHVHFIPSKDCHTTVDMARSFFTFAFKLRGIQD